MEYSWWEIFQYKFCFRKNKYLELAYNSFNKEAALESQIEELRRMAGDKFFMIYNKIEEYILLNNATPNLNWASKGKAGDLNNESEADEIEKEPWRLA